MQPRSSSSDVSRYGPGNSLCTVLKDRLILQMYLTHLALEAILFFDVGQVLLLEVLRRVAGCIEFVDEAFFFRVVQWQR